MGLLETIFGRKKATVTADRISLTVLYITMGDGLSEKDAAAIREIILNAEPIDFYFLNPGAFEICFSGLEDGLLKGTKLADSIRRYAQENTISPFGVGLRTGECTVAIKENGGFSMPPSGAAVLEAMKEAVNEATAHAI